MSTDPAAAAAAAKHAKKKTSSSKKSHHSKDSKHKKKPSKKKPAFLSEDTPKKVRLLPDLGDADVHKEYTLMELIGHGAFAKVYRGVDNKTKEIVAIKVIDKSKVGVEVSPHHLQTEVAVLQRIKHPYVINLRRVYEDDDNLYIVTELATGGELFDQLIKYGAYTESDAAELTKRIVSAINYLHENGIVHRDLKPENLLLATKDDILNIRVADFGLAKVVGNNTLIQTMVGSPNYVAPEVLNGGGYTRQADLWSIGVITFILLSGYAPFNDPNIYTLIDLIKAGRYSFDPEYWDPISDNAKDFVRRLLVVDPDKRMTCEEALNHPWLANKSAKDAAAKPLDVKTGLKQTVDNWKGTQEEDVADEVENDSVYEMTTKPATFDLAKFNIQITKAKIYAAFYKFLYKTMTNFEPSASDVDNAVSSADIQVYVLYVDNTPAGFVELQSKDVTSGVEVNIANSGLLAEYRPKSSTGNIFSQLLFNFAVNIAWSIKPQVVRVVSQPDSVNADTLTQLGFIKKN